MQETGIDVGIYLITDSDAIVSIVDMRLRLPTQTLLRGMQARMQLEIRYEQLGQARHFCQDYLNST